MESAEAYSRFLRRARRRWMAWRVVECAGICASAGAAVGFLIIPILMWREQPTLNVAAILIALGAVVGVCWALTRRPSLLETAILVDRQLNLHDLLSTAMSSSQWTDPTFAAIVQDQASAACMRISPAELIVQRLGGRAWGGIGIVTALLLTLALMSSQPSATEARNNQNNDQTTVHDLAERRGNPSIDQAGRTSAARQQNQRTNRSDDTESDGSNNPDRFRTAEASKSNAQTVKADAGGAAAGRTNDKSTARLQTAGAPISDQPSRDQAATEGRSGSGTDLERQISSGDVSGLVKSGGLKAAPWRSDDWQAKREAAIEGLRDGRIPDAYQDMVRQYFDHSDR